MQYCLQLAALGAGYTAPNPLVGAVLVHEGRIIGEGYHQQYGEAHAEVNCLASVKEADRPLIASATLYVSLEPCAHHGKTPPCTGLILRHHIPRVVVACRDPYHEVDGLGIRQLQEAGVEVTTGVLEEAARRQNRRFFTYHQQRRPYIVLKWAQSANGMLAAAGSRAVDISHPLTNRLVHRWRSEEAAIMVGTRTAIHDNPRLTNRLWAGPQPIRVLIDRQLQVPATHHLLADGGKTLVINSLRNEQRGSISYVQLPAAAFQPRHILQCLYERGIQSVLVEGGAALLQSFIDESCWDECRVITNSQMIIPDGVAAPVLTQQRIVDSRQLLRDQITTYHPLTNHT